MNRIQIFIFHWIAVTVKTFFWIIFVSLSRLGLWASGREISSLPVGIWIFQIKFYWACFAVNGLGIVTQIVIWKKILAKSRLRKDAKTFKSSYQHVS